MKTILTLELYLEIYGFSGYKNTISEKTKILFDTFLEALESGKPTAAIWKEMLDKSFLVLKTEPKEK